MVKIDATRFLAGSGLLLGLLMGYFAWQAYQHPSIIVEWSTASELEVAGFNLLRGETPEGPFARVNEQMIPPSDDPLTGKAYAFTDETVEGGKTYFYQLQEVEIAGATNNHGPVEVQAARGGIIETVLAGILIVGSIFFLARGKRP